MICSTRHHFPRLWLCGLLAGLVVCAKTCAAQVSVSPTFVLFDDEAATKAISVENTSPRKLVVRISLVDLRMLPGGKMVHADTSVADEHFADGMVRYSPRELVLEPGRSEVVRFQVPPCVNRPAGEFRTHVLVQQVPDVSALAVSPFAPTDGVSVDAQAVFGVAIPIIIRQGALLAAVRITGARLENLLDGAPSLALSIERSGARSVRGALSILLDGDEIDRYEGVAIYAPATRRDLSLLLPTSQHPLAGHKLEMRFSETDIADGAAEATDTLELPAE
jgi:hypothetical protein